MGVKTTPTEPEFFTINTRRLFDNFQTGDFHQIWTEHVNGNMSKRLFEVVSEVLVNFCVQCELRFRNCCGVSSLPNLRIVPIPHTFR